MQATTVKYLIFVIFILSINHLLCHTDESYAIHSLRLSEQMNANMREEGGINCFAEKIWDYEGRRIPLRTERLVKKCPQDKPKCCMYLESENRVRSRLVINTRYSCQIDCASPIFVTIYRN